MKRKKESAVPSENNFDAVEFFLDKDIEGMEWILDEELIENIESERSRRAAAAVEKEHTHDPNAAALDSDCEDLYGNESVVGEKKQFIKSFLTQNLWTTESATPIQSRKKPKYNRLSVFAHLEPATSFVWNLDGIENRTQAAMPPIESKNELCTLFLPKKVELDTHLAAKELMKQVRALPKGHYIQFPKGFDLVLAKNLIRILPEYTGFYVSNEIKDILYPEIFPENIFLMISNNVAQFFAFYTTYVMNKGKIYFEPGHNNVALAVAVMEGIRKSQKNCEKIVQISSGCSKEFVAAIAEHLPECTEVFINPTSISQYQIDAMIDNLKNKSTVLFLNPLAPAWASIRQKLDIFNEYLLTQICSKWPDTTIVEDDSLLESTSENEHAFFKSGSKQDQSCPTDLDLDRKLNR